MIKKLLIVAALSTSLYSAELSKPRFEGDGSTQKVYIIKPFLNKTPSYVLKAFNKKVNFNERDEVGFSRWVFEKDVKGKEDLATYKLVVVDEKWVIEGRRVFSLELEFSRPIGTNKPWLCWDAVYRLCAKGVDPSR
tara:strand:+ start:2930 stop:3337 length:408 start_codon:yes stop_codon:yes gene_type:complete